jgi:dimethylargininase
LDRTLYVGQGARSNAVALMQMRALLAPHGYAVEGVVTRDCLHLKSAVTQVADDAVLVQPRWLDAGMFRGWRCIEADPDEPHAANALRIGETVLVPANFPRTRRRLANAGIPTIAVDVSELQKAEGAVTCCSVLVEVDD